MVPIKRHYSLEGAASSERQDRRVDGEDVSRNLHRHHGENRPQARIFLDFHRNARSATAVGAYSLRAVRGLPASTPVAWDDLDSIDAPEDLNYATVPGFLSNSGDPWADMDAHAVALGPEVASRLSA